MLYKNGGKLPRGRPRTIWIDQIRKHVEMRGENWEEIQENRKWESKMAGDFSVIVYQYLWK